MQQDNLSAVTKQAPDATWWCPIANVVQGQPAVVLKSQLGMDCPE